MLMQMKMRRLRAGEEEEGKGDCMWNPLLCVIPSETCYDKSEAEDVIVFEPPHLARDVENFYNFTSDYALARRWSELSGKTRVEFNEKFSALLNHYQA